MARLEIEVPDEMVEDFAEGVIKWLVEERDYDITITEL